jgi:predicted RND superfamily exporter protein
MIERLIRASYARRGTVLLAAGAVLVVCLVLVARLSFDANILRLLPRKGPAARSFGLYLQQFGTVDHVYILFEVPPGREISDREAFIDRYVERLRASPEIASVDAELFDDLKDWSYLFDRALLLLGKDQAQAALGRFTAPGMARQLAQSRGLLAVSSPQVKAYVQMDPLGVLGLLRDQLGRGRALVEFDPMQRGYVSRDGRSRLVIAKPVRPPFDTDFCKRLFARLADIEASAHAAGAADDEESGSPAGAADVTVQVAGGYRIALEAERMIRRELVVNSLFSLAALLLLVLVVFRTPWILLYGTVPLVLAALLTLGVNGLNGPLSPATSGASAMLFGLGIDGIVLLYLRYMEEREHGLSEPEAIARSSGTATSIMLAYGTTAATFLALVLVDFPSLEDLGRLVGLGILVCCVLLLTLVPALIRITGPKAGRRAIVSPWLGRLVEQHGRLILVSASVVTLALGAAASRLHLDTSLDRLRTHTSGAVLEEQIAARFSLPRDVILALGEGPDLELLLASARGLAGAVARDLPSVVVSAPDMLLPPAPDQAAVREVLDQSRLDGTAVAAEFERQAAAAGFRPGTFQPFLERLPRILDRSQRLTYDGLAEHHLTALVSRHVARVPEGYVVVVYLYPRKPGDIDRLSAFVAAHAPSFQVTGVTPVNRELAERAFPQFLRGVGVGTLAVALMMYFVFRSVRHSLLAFLPTALGFVWSAGLLSLLGAKFDLFSLFAAMTFIGIATDYGIYVIYRYSVEGTRPMREVLARTGTGVLIACGATLIGFGSLINSSYPPLHSFGITSVTTIASCLVASLLVLPAVLQEVGRP